MPNEMDHYIEKLCNFNKREDYSQDINVARLLLEFCISQTKTRKIFFAGTGLGADIRIVANPKKFNIVGIEPRQTLHKQTTKTYEKFNARLIKTDLGKFTKSFKRLSGVFLFIHSINHIPKKQIKEFRKIINNSYIIIINPNPILESITGKTDHTVISYLSAKQIKRLLNAEIIFDLFYNSVNIKGKETLLREAIVCKIS